MVYTRTNVATKYVPCSVCDGCIVEVLMNGGVESASFAARWTVIAVSRIGIPYKFGGDGKDGIDCSQLVVDVMRLMGFDVPDKTADDLRREFFTLDVPPAGGPSISAIFRKNTAGKAIHIGLIVGDGSSVVHATAQAGRVILQGTNLTGYDEIKYLDVRPLITYLTPIRREMASPLPKLSR